MRTLKHNKLCSKTTADDLLDSHYRKALFRHFYFPLFPTVQPYNNSSRRGQQGNCFSALLCNRSGLLTSLLLHTLTQTKSSEDSALLFQNNILAFLHLLFVEDWISPSVLLLVFTLWVPPSVSMVLLIINFDMSVEMIGLNFQQ